MSTELDGKPWRKAISPERDRRQSQVLAWAVGVGVACLTFQTGVFASGLIMRFPAFVFGTIGISIIFGRQLLNQPDRRVIRLPGVNVSRGEPAPPDLVAKAQRPGRMPPCQAD